MREDGFAPADRDTASKIKRAARVGCLIWDASRITTTDASRIDLRSVSAIADERKHDDFAAREREQYASGDYDRAVLGVQS